VHEQLWSVSDTLISCLFMTQEDWMLCMSKESRWEAGMWWRSMMQFGYGF
jgi:hypothetical protein